MDMGGLVQDCGNSSANALELPQSCPKQSIHNHSAMHDTTVSAYTALCVSECVCVSVYVWVSEWVSE